MSDKHSQLPDCAYPTSQLNEAGGLVALVLAKQDGIVQSVSQENLFLVRWLATAQKQRRFPRDVAPDIDWLLKQGRQHGVRARLPEKLDYLWRSCHGELSEQSDLYRLTYAFEMAKEAGWIYDLLADREWTGRHTLTLNPAVNGIYALRSSVDASFDSDGRLLAPLKVRITGNVDGIRELFESCGWKICSVSEQQDKNDYLRGLMLSRTKTHVRREKSSEKSFNGQWCPLSAICRLKNTALGTFFTVHNILIYRTKNH